MSAPEVIKDCVVDGLFGVECDNNRHYQRVVITMSDLPGKKRSADGDDDGDEAEESDAEESDVEEEEEEVDDDEEGGAEKEKKKKKKKKPKKRRRGVRMPKTRAVLQLNNKLPFVHAGAQFRASLRLLAPQGAQLSDRADAYEIVECYRYQPSIKLAFRAIRAALSNPTRVVESRRERIAAHEQLRAANLTTFIKGDANIQNRPDAPMPQDARDLLNRLGSKLAFPTTLASLQMAFVDGSRRQYTAQLELGLSAFFAIQAVTLIGYGQQSVHDVTPSQSMLVPHVVVRTLDRLVCAPHNASASTVELLTMAQLIECAKHDDYVDAMFMLPDARSERASAISRTSCRNNAIFREWRLARPDQLAMQSSDRLAGLLGRLPVGVNLGFIWEAAEWYQARRTRYGATVFECEEEQASIDSNATDWARQLARVARENGVTNPAARAVTDDTVEAPVPLDDNDDDQGSAHSEPLDALQPLGALAPPVKIAPHRTAADDDDAISEDLDAPPHAAPSADGGHCGLSRTHWMSEQCNFTRPAPRGCYLRDAKTALYSSIRAHETTQCIVAATRKLDMRLVLFNVRASGGGTGAVGDETFTHVIVHACNVREARVARNGVLPLVLIVFPSESVRLRYREWLSAQKPDERFTLTTMTLENLLVNCNLEWSTRLPIRLATRVVVIDAHALCEHDMASLLTTFADGNEASGELALCGEVDGVPPEAHRESGAPFVDMWRSQLIRREYLDAGAVGVRGYQRENTERLSALIDSSPARVELAKRYATCTITRAHEISVCLLNGNYSVQVCGNRLTTLASGCALLATFLRRHIEKDHVRSTISPNDREIAQNVIAELNRWSETPRRSETFVLKTLPYVRYRGAIVRVDTMYRQVRECDRTQRLVTSSHLERIFSNNAGVSLDTFGLYVRLENDARAHVDVDHRACCFTDHRLLLSVARHRRELRSASIMLARESARTVDANLSNLCMLVLPLSMADAGVENYDAEQLVVAPSRCTRLVRFMLPHAPPEQVKSTFEQLAESMGRFRKPPPTQLRAALQEAHGVSSGAAVDETPYEDDAFDANDAYDMIDE